jgi:hypothetical protein
VKRRSNKRDFRMTADSVDAALVDARRTLQEEPISIEWRRNNEIDLLRNLQKGRVHGML